MNRREAREINETMRNYRKAREINETMRNYHEAKEINETMRQYGMLNSTVGELCVEPGKRLDSFTEIKIKGGLVRVVHRHWIDKLNCAKNIDAAMHYE